MRFDERYRATPRADIWIHRPTGSVRRKKRLTKRGLLKDIAADFAVLGLRCFRIHRRNSPAVHLIVELNRFAVALVM